MPYFDTVTVTGIPKRLLQVLSEFVAVLAGVVVRQRLWKYSNIRAHRRPISLADSLANYLGRVTWLLAHQQIGECISDKPCRAVRPARRPLM